jgi:hypothetical protein
MRARPFAFIAGAGVVAAAFTLYLATAARDIVYGDSPELASVALTLGVAHPPGYPIFTMLGWLFGQLPVGSLSFRISLLSVVCHAATVGVIYAATLRFTRSVAAALVAAAALAFEPVFWAWSLVPEVFPLNDLLSATMLLLVALWHEHPERKWLLIGGGLVGGLGMANHQTIALLSPAVFYLMWRRRKVLLREPRLVVNAGIAFVLGLTPYLELLVAASRHPAWSWGDLQGPADLVGHFLRKSYGTSSLLVGAQFIGGSPTDRVIALLAAFDPFQVILLALGVGHAWRVKRWYATYLLIGFAIAGPLFTAYSNANLKDETTRTVLERFFLMPQAAIAPLSGFGVLALREAVGRVGLGERIASLGLAIAGLAGAFAFVPLEYRQIDQSQSHFARTFANDILATLKPNSVFLASGDPVLYPIGYLQTIEGVRPDVTVVTIPLVPAEWYVRELKRLHRDLVIREDRYGAGGGAPFKLFIDANRGRPIAAIGDMPDASTGGVYWFYSRGIVFEVKPLSEIVLLDDMAAESEQILAGYHAPAYAEVAGPFRTWERLSLVDYGLGYYRVGKEFETGADSMKTKDPAQAAQLYETARSWYRRALEVDPDLAEAKEHLARLGP